MTADPARRRLTLGGIVQGNRDAERSRRSDMEGHGDTIWLTRHEIRPASEVLARAFYEDPQSVYFYPDLAERSKRLRYAFEFTVRYGVLYGEVHATSENLEGIAVWVRSEAAEKTLPRLIRCRGLSTIVKVGWDVYRRQQPIEEYIDMMHKRCAPFRHWYLDPLGVEPRHQGKGYGSRLMREMMKRVDGEGLPIYLYTTREPNVRMYERYGFNVVGEGELPGTGIPHWSMVREPGA
jgi:ribosomal protein S18 acetylase RimI-like enzyme